VDRTPHERRGRVGLRPSQLREGVIELHSVTAATFAEHLHESFAVDAGEGQPLSFELVEVASSEGAATGRPFSAVFLGPAEPVLRQRIHRLEHAELGSLELFLVPIGPGRYEAIFT
jgi:hypothetical protein